MKLKELFDQLTFGELSQLSIGGQDAGVINDSNMERIIAQLNVGLSALYTRFNLKEGRLILDLQPTITTYNLHSNFAVANTRSRELIKYILDTSVNPFKDDVIKIERVYSEKGFEFSLNNLSDAYSLSTPSLTVLRIPEMIASSSMGIPVDMQTDTLEVVYRARHKSLIDDCAWIDPERYEVELPYSHMEALLYFVASRVNNPIGMSQEFHAGNSYAAKYEMACQRLEEANLEIDQGSQSTNFTRGGWV